MKFFLPNIDNKGRWMRGFTALALLVAGLLTLNYSAILGGLLLASGAFVLFEAMRGWCVARACGIKTKY